MSRLPPGIFVLIIALLSAFAGALLTWLIRYAPDGREDDPAPQSSDHESSSAETRELLRVSRTKQGLAVFVQGKPLRHLREVTDPQVGHETVAAIRAVLSFAEGWLPPMQEQRRTSRSRNRPSMSDKATSAPRVPGTTPVTFGRSSQPSLSKPLRLVEEIDALVQERLQARPDLAERGIRLTHDVDGSILIYVGQQRYRSAGEIPDEVVRDFIRDAIRTWESR
jgi:hypothetical protein